MNEEAKKRLLWVDDEPTVLMMVAMLLQSYNYEVVTAESSKEALDILEQDPNFDLLGTDIRMAKMDGLDMARVVKERYPNLPIIVLSAHASDEAREIAAQIGVLAYIHKPFKVDDLLNTIESALANGK